MLVVLSPAKALDFSPAPASLPHTTPLLGDDTADLATVTRTLTAGDLRRLMDISDALADLNHARFQAFGSPVARRVLAWSARTADGTDLSGVSRITSTADCS